MTCVMLQNCHCLKCLVNQFKWRMWSALIDPRASVNYLIIHTDIIFNYICLPFLWNTLKFVPAMECCIVYNGLFDIVKLAIKPKYWRALEKYYISFFCWKIFARAQYIFVDIYLCKNLKCICHTIKKLIQLRYCIRQVHIIRFTNLTTFDTEIVKMINLQKVCTNVRCV